MSSTPTRNLTKQISLATAAAGVVILVLAFGFIFLIGTAFSSRTPDAFLDDRADWPKPLRELLAQASRAQIDVEPVKVYRAVDFTERYFYWQMRSSPELVTLMTSEWELTPGTQADLNWFWQRWPRDWKVGGAKDHQTFLGNYKHKSDNFIVIVNESEPVLYGYYYFNF